MQMKIFACAMAAVLLLCLPARSQQASDSTAPEQATKTATAKIVTAKSYMVAAANPVAAATGAEILAQGGSAIDAAVVVQTILGLVEPQSSGLGGGAFLVYYDAGKKRLVTLDGRETAPQRATPQLFLDNNGQPLEFFAAVVGGRSVGTPGTVRLLQEAHNRYGALDWKTLFEPAAALADAGFAVSPRLAALIAAEGDKLKTYERTKTYFFDAAGAPLKAGTILKNPDYATTLRSIARNGADAFYTGPIA
ncbi:MAG TPA: gamma-glutamyltransferase, partial [Mycoplana sp.]|nr:gamma-glutamyltransferase [Mycoplana sp.]